MADHGDTIRVDEQARATLSQVGKRYPGTDAARVADDQLRAMQLSQVR